MSTPPIFFLHLPRTAGTTIDAIFKQNLPAESILKIYSQSEYQKYKKKKKDRLSDIKYITGHLLLDTVNPPTFYGEPVRAITLLRDPIKRLISEYIFLKTWKKQHLYSYLNDNAISFSQYITSEEKILVYRGKNFMTRCISGDSLEQTNNINESLEKAKYNLSNNFWFFGLQERFMESIVYLSEKAELNNILHDKHNALILKKDEFEISQADINLAQEYNAADIALYNFAATEFDKRIKQLGDSFNKKVKNFTFLNLKYQKISNILYDSIQSEEQSTTAIRMPKDIKW